MASSTPSRTKRTLTSLGRLALLLIVIAILIWIAGRFVELPFWPRTYSATAQFRIIFGGPFCIRGVLISPEFESYWNSFQSDELSKVKDRLRSPEFLLPVIHDLALNRVWAVGVFHLKQGEAASDPVVLDHLLRVLDVEMEEQTEVFAVTVRDGRSNEAAAIANAIANRFKALADSGHDLGFVSLRDGVIDWCRKDVAAKQANLEKIGQEAPSDAREAKLRVAQYDLDQAKSTLDKIDHNFPTSDAPSVRILTLAQPPASPDYPADSRLLKVIAIVGLSLAGSAYAFRRADES